MKKNFFLIFHLIIIFFSPSILNAQSPYIATKDGDVIEYDEVRKGKKKTIVCTANGSEISYAVEDLKIAGLGMINTEDKIRQIIFGKLKVNLVGKGTWQEGNKAYNVISKQGNNILINSTNSVMNPGLVGAGSLSGVGTGGWSFYFINDRDVQFHNTLSSKEEILRDFSSAAGDCNEMIEIIEGYRDKKYNSIPIVLFKIHNAYYESCYQK